MAHSHADDFSPFGAVAVAAAPVAPPTGRVAGFTAASIGWILDGFETYAVVLVGPSVVANLVGVHASPLYFGGIIAMTLFAWACGGLLSGLLTDYFGRKRTLMYSIVWYAVFTGLTATAHSYAVFLSWRFLTGLGMGAAWGPGSALVSEIWPNRSRGRGIALLQGGFGIGFIIATGVWAAVDTGPTAWRKMFLIGILPALVALYVWRFAKDPEIWVASHERRLAVRGRKRAGHMLTDADAAWSMLTVRYLFRDRALRRQVLLLVLLSMSTLVGWWATSTWIPQYTAHLALLTHRNPASAITFIALLYNAGGVVGYFAMGFLADWLGRKPTMFVYFVGGLALDFLLFKTTHSFSATSLPLFAAVNGFFTLGQFTWMAMYPVELFPTAVRGTAITIVFNATRFIAAAFAVLASYLVSFFGGIPSAATVIALIYVVGIVLVFWAGPETKGRPLPA